MTCEEIRDALGQLRLAGAALRKRPPRDTLEVLAGLLDAWNQRESAWQRSLAEKLPEATGFSPEMVEEGLARGLAPYTGVALHALVERELGGIERLEASSGQRAAGFDTTATLLAGAIPMPTLISVIAPLILRSPVLAKPSVRDPVTAPLLARALGEDDPELGACLRVFDFRGDDEACLDALLEADCVVAAGSDETLASVMRRVRPPRRVVGYGHRFSMAVLGPQCSTGERLEETAAGIALDVALWDQLGCLSPVVVYVVDPAPDAADRVADALAIALETAEARWPRGRIEPEAAAAIARERSELEMRAAGGAATSLRTSRGTAWTVTREPDLVWRPAPLYRFVRVHPAPDLAACLDALRPHGAHLAAVALGGFGKEAREVATQLAQGGASRVCPPGRLQSPPLGWHHDNRRVLAPLVRWTDLEVA